MPKIDFSGLPVRSGSAYPGGYAAQIGDRRQVALGDPMGLTQFGVNHVTLGPGGQSALRHWHVEQDEFLVVTSGVCTLIDDDGETDLHPGDCAAFPANDGNGHHLVNNTDSDASFIVVGTRTKTETGHYSDVDMMVRFDEQGFDFTRRDGSPIED